MINLEEEKKLLLFQDILKEHNTKVNLISRKETDIWNRHILNSLIIIPYLNKENTIMDIGTGAGFPGIMLAIMGFPKIILVESKKKKCDFLNIVKEKFTLPVTILNNDINSLNIKVDTIVSRALASIDKLLTMTQKIKFKEMILIKGEKLTLEIEEAKKNWNFQYEIYDQNIVKIFRIRSH